MQLSLHLAVSTPATALLGESSTTQRWMMDHGRCGLVAASKWAAQQAVQAKRMARHTIHGLMIIRWLEAPLGVGGCRQDRARNAKSILVPDA